MNSITILIAAACVGLTIATAATAQLPSTDRWLQLDVPPGNVEMRPAPPNWKPHPVWAPNGVAPAGYVHPSTLVPPKDVDPYFPGALKPDDVSHNDPGPGWEGRFPLIRGETKTKLLKREVDALAPSDASQPDQGAKAMEGLHPFSMPVVASPPATPQAIPVKPVKTETIQGTATDPVYARYQKVWTFPVPDRAGNARALTEHPFPVPRR